MVGRGKAVRVPKGRAEATERDLAARGRCNWLIDWTRTEHVYCGRPARGELCSEHIHNMMG
jgi:hypothetical protein